MLIVLCGLFVLGMIVVGTGILLLQLRDRAMADRERELQSLALALAEQADRSFQAVEVVQKNLISRMRMLGIATSEDYEQRMSSYEAHLMLKDIMSGLPHTDALVLVGSQGKVINVSQNWPVRAVDVSDRDYFKALKSIAEMVFYLGEPVRNRVTGAWTIQIARKFSGPNGEFLGLVLGAIELRYFEEFYQNVALAKDSSIALIRRDGMLLARHPHVEAMTGKFLPFFPEVLSKVNVGAVRLTSIIDSQDHLYAAHALTNYPIVVSVGTTVAAAVADWRTWALYAAGTSFLLLLVVGSIIFLCAWGVQKKLRTQNLQFEAALNNMSQGLVMYDSATRLVVSNKRFLQMYGLSAERIRPGCTLRELLNHRQEVGDVPKNLDQYIAEVLAAVSHGKSDSREIESTNGRCYRITNQPMADGGWVATHEDITERRRMEEEIRTQNVQFEAALGNMSEGLSMFDRTGRIVLHNARYLEIFNIPREFIKPGWTIFELLERLAEIGIVSGDQKKYAADLLAALAQGKTTNSIRALSDGRTVKITNRPMPDGGWVATYEDITEQRRGELAVAKARSEAERAEREARTAHARLLDAFEVVPEGLVLFDAEDRYVLWNRHYAELYPESAGNIKAGLRFEEVLRANLASGHFPDSDGREEEWIAERLARHAAANSTHEQHLPNDRWLRIQESRTSDGGSIGVRIDITELKQREILFRLLFEGNPLPMYVFDFETLRFLAVNDAAVAHFGYSREQFLAMSVLDVRPAEDRDRLLSSLQTFQQFYLAEARRLKKADGTTFEADIYSRSLTYEGRVARFAAIVDITERRQAERQIAYMAHYDTLTGLPNRALFCEELDRALARVQRGERLALLYLDLDHFKRVNDTLGHLIGDELLKTAADRLRGCVRETDLIARLGGDEFAIIQTSLEQPSDAAALATRIIETIRAAYDFGDQQAVVGVSIGISIAPDDAIERDQLLKNADMALYGAKGSGRGAYHFYEPEMDARMKARQKLENDLRNALGNGEFELYYQPIVNLNSNRISGCEALLRWHHPERGLVEPTESIPVAEETGLIIPIGEWVLRQACADAATWPDDIKIAVNLSPAQLKGGKLAEVVVSALAASGLPACRLELEITETVLMQDTVATLATLHQLHDLGVQISMDDFGTGYSSLSYLRSFPFDKIKIDRCFIETISEKDDCVAIVQAVTNMAQQLHMTTVAEGIETEDQRTKVLELGCTEMQGYLFSRPQPVEDIVRMFLTRAERKASAA